MKNVKRFLTLFLLLGLMLSVAVFAGEKDAPGTISEIKVETDYAENVETEVIESGRGAYESFKLTYSDAADGGMYLVLVQSETGLPTGENILYVNQVTAGEDPEVDGAYFANVYPSEIVYEEVKAEAGNNYSYIYLSGTNLSHKLVGTIIPNVEATAPEFTVEIIGTKNAATYSVNDDATVLNVVNDEAVCVVGYTTDDYATCTKLAATQVVKGYDFDISEVPNGAVIFIAVKGDMTQDGELKGPDVGQVKAAQLGKLKTVSALQIFVSDLNADGELKGPEVGQIKAAQLGKLPLKW
ncbi:MAG: hypothetical protein J6J51_01735 [Clostridia bacterium]|nr:hypothetical protein [Clostridia bacterium]